MQERRKRVDRKFYGEKVGDEIFKFFGFYELKRSPLCHFSTSFDKEFFRFRYLMRNNWIIAVEC